MDPYSKSLELNQKFNTVIVFGHDNKLTEAGGKRK